MTKRIFLVLLTVLFAANAAAEPIVYPTNKDGSTISGILTADYDPTAAVVPIPTNLFFSGTDDFTLNPPVDDPNDYTDPFVQISTMDGFSTTEKWVTTFTGRPNALDPASVVPGQSVRMFEVSTVFGTIVMVSGIVRELVPGVDYVAVAQGNNLAILPLKPLKEMTTYMAVLTNDINDTQGNDATPDTFYHIAKSETPWVDANGNSTYALFDDATAASAEGLRQIKATEIAAAVSVGIPKEDIILSWTAQTQSITPVLKNLRSIARPVPTTVGPAGMDTSMLGGFGLADIYAGIITLPYYLGVPSAESPTAPLTDFWTAEPGAYVAPFDSLGLNPTSTFVTVANPFPVVTSQQTVPLLMTVPSAASGHTKPAAGWPVVIFGHGLGGNRANLLAAADAIASAGYAAVAIDFPLHGVSPDDPLLAPLYVGNGPFAGVANERTFDVDYVDNVTGAPGPDGMIDPSGTHIINLSSALTSRDNLRQGQADLGVLAATIPSISIDGDMLPDLDGGTVAYVGISMGSIMGTPFLGAEPTISNAFLSVPMGGLARGLEASPTFGPSIRAGLEAAAGIVPGMVEYEQFFIVLQTIIDSGDPINWSAETAMFNNIVLHEVIGDTVTPNYVPTAPLSGTEPMIAVMGLQAYSSTQSDPNGVDLAGRFLPPATHGSFLSPSSSPEATAEMQGQLVSFLASRGTTVVVNNAATMVPVAAPAEAEEAPEKETNLKQVKVLDKEGG